MELPKFSIPRKANTVSIEMPSGLEFWELIIPIEQSFPECFLLESAGDNQYDSRYSVIGFAPHAHISGTHSEIRINQQAFTVANPYFSLRDILSYDSLSVGYQGGLVGYLSYDAMRYFEPSLKIEGHPDFPAMEFGLYLDGLLFDKYTGQVTYFFHEENRLPLVSEILKKAKQEKSKASSLKIKFLSSSATRDSHNQMVQAALEEIKSGNTFQCQIGFQEDYEVVGDSTQIYKSLREINPSPHMFFVKFKDRKIIGASPELLFRLRQKEMESFPLAGTTKRGKNNEEDVLLARTLLSDPKEIAEHNMLIDLHRNDIGRVAKFGTVKVRRRFDIKRFSHVQHISSEVVGILRSEEDMFSGLAYSFPAGTLSGAPKIESMKIIDRIEKSPRGPYGGAVGVFGLNGDCTFAIPIRTFFQKGNKGYVRASGGIVLDSSPEGEYQEIINKMASVKKALERFF